MSEWITDRLPTKEDGNLYCKVWVTYKNGEVGQEHWSDVTLSKPWQRIIDKPAPYVKPKRWTVKWDNNHGWFCLAGSEHRRFLLYLQEEHADAAQRIADIYNEVMP